MRSSEDSELAAAACLALPDNSFSAQLLHQQPIAATFSLVAWASVASTIPRTSPLLRMSTMRNRRFILLARSLVWGGGVAWPHKLTPVM